MFTDQDLEAAVRDVDSEKATGPDYMNVRNYFLINDGPEKLVRELKIILNSGVIPDYFK